MRSKTMSKPSDEKDLDANLKKLAAIAEWFESQDEEDTLQLEEGLKKVKEAGQLIKASHERLRVIENEFEEIKRNVDQEADKARE